LLTCDGATRTNFEQVVDFGLWQDPFVKSIILVHCFWWGHLVWIATNPFEFQHLSQMQGIDRKYNGHVWWKLVTTNIKNSIGLNFKKARCLGHL
jgi:hypothetical protein